MNRLVNLHWKAAFCSKGWVYYIHQEADTWAKDVTVNLKELNIRIRPTLAFMISLRISYSSVFSAISLHLCRVLWVTSTLKAPAFLRLSEWVALGAPTP